MLKLRVKRVLALKRRKLEVKCQLFVIPEHGARNLIKSCPENASGIKPIRLGHQGKTRL